METQNPPKSFDMNEENFLLMRREHWFFARSLEKLWKMFTIFTAKIDWKNLIIMAILHYRKQRIMLLARLNLGLASEDKEEIDLYNHYQKNIYSEQNQQQQ